MHIGDIGSRDLSWRRLGVLLRQLPPESATMTAIRGYEAWSYEAHLTAVVADRILQVNSPKGRRPKLIPRPGDKKTATLGGRGLTVAQFELSRRREWVETSEVEEVE